MQRTQPTIAGRLRGSRPWGGRATLAVLLLSLPGVLAGVSPSADPLLGAVPDVTDLDERYDAWELQAMDPYSYGARLDAGEVELTLRGETFRVLVERQPWLDGFRIGDVGPDGAIRYRSPAFAPVAYVGRVLDEPGSLAVVVLTGAGVSGQVKTATEEILFEPLQFVQEGAPVGVSLVYRARDGNYPASHAAAFDDAAATSAASSSSPVGVAAASPGPDRLLALFADQSMVNIDSTLARVSSDFATFNANWHHMMGFKFNLVSSTVFTCTTCTSTDFTQLLTQLAQFANVTNQPWSSYELAHLHKGDATNAGGAAWQPGRYTYVHGGAWDSNWRYKAMGHEFAHAFGARHEWGATYPHRHWDGIYTHHTLLTDTTNSPKEWTFELSTRNQNWVRSCNANTWKDGTKTAGDQFSFGENCGWKHLMNGGDVAQYEAAVNRGKLYTGVPQGTVVRLCIYAQTPGTTANVAVKTGPDASAPLFSVNINVQWQGWNCASPPTNTWTSSNIFVYKSSGTAAIGWDTNAPGDSYSSNDGGFTWSADGTRRGLTVHYLRTTLPQETCGILASGASLGRDQAVRSCNNLVDLVHQMDGNLVLYNRSRVDYATHTSGQATTSLVMQGDGNLVLYNGGTPVWASDTAGNPGAWLSVRNDGDVAIYSPGGATLWQAGCGLLWTGHSLARAREIRSCNGATMLAHQGDGNLVLYHNGGAVWASGTQGRATTRLTMQGDGNLVLYNGGTPIWDSATPNNDGSRLLVLNEAKFGIFNHRSVVKTYP